MRTTTRTRPPARRLSPLLAVPLLVLANPVQADPYEPQVTTGALQAVCHDFAIDSDVLSAKCNKVGTDGLIGPVDVIEWVQSESKFGWKTATAVRAPSTGNLTAYRGAPPHYRR